MIFWLLKRSWLLVLAIQNYSDAVKINSVFLLKFLFFHVMKWVNYDMHIQDSEKLEL